MESALDYVSDMKNFIEQNISVLPHRSAPKYRLDMEYIAYPTNKRTTWYIFF
jgi:hypothetical protein